MPPLLAPRPPFRPSLPATRHHGDILIITADFRHRPMSRCSVLQTPPPSRCSPGGPGRRTGAARSARLHYARRAAARCLLSSSRPPPAAKSCTRGEMNRCGRGEAKNGSIGNVVRVLGWAGGDRGEVSARRLIFGATSRQPCSRARAPACQR